MIRQAAPFLLVLASATTALTVSTEVTAAPKANTAHTKKAPELGVSLLPALRPPTVASPAEPGGVESGSDDETEQASGDLEVDVEPGRKRRVVKNGAYLLYFYQFDPVDNESLLHVLGLYWHRDKPDYQLRALVPFGAYWQWKETERWGLISPLYWRSDHGDAVYEGSWLWHRWRSPTTRFSTLAPLYWHHHDLRSDDELTIVGTGYWRTRPGLTDWGILPLMWGQSGEDSTSLTVLPLLSYQDDPTERSLLSPAFFHNRDKTTGDLSGGIIPLLTTWWTSGEETSFLQFPLVYHRRSPTSSTTFITPFVGGGSTGDPDDPDLEWTLSFPAFVGINNNRTGEQLRLFTPLLYARWTAPEDDEHFGMLGPAYTYRDDAERAHGIFPLFWSWADESTGENLDVLLPLYFASNVRGQRHRWLLPALYGQSLYPDGTALTMWGPLFDFRNGPGGDHHRGLFPLAWFHDNHLTGEATDVVFPLFLHTEDPTRHTTIVPPLLYLDHEDDDADTELTIAGPIYHHRRGLEESWGAAPLYFHHHDDEAGTDFSMIPGLWYHHSTPEKQVDHWGPLWRRNNSEVSEIGMLPLWAWRTTHETELDEFFLSPGIYLAEGRDIDRLAIGPFWRFRDKDSADDGLFPLFASHRERDGSHLFLSPVFADKLEMNEVGEAEYRFTWLLNGVRYANRDGYEMTTVAPLYLEAKDGSNGDWTTLALPWIYASGNTWRDERFVFALPWIDSETRYRRNWALLPLAGGHRDRTSSWWVAGPVAAQFRDFEDDSVLSLGAAGLYGHYERGDTVGLGERAFADRPSGKDLGWVGPYFWHETRSSRLRLAAPLYVDYDNLEEDSYLTSVFPLFFSWGDKQDGIDRSLHSLVPFYVRYNEVYPDGTNDSLTTVGPLFGYDGRGGRGFGLFPLFWHDHLTYADGGGAGHNVVFPFVWNFYDDQEGSESTVAGPIYSFVRPRSEHYGIAPLLFAGTTETPFGDAGYAALAPFLYRQHGFTDEGEATETIITPVGYHTASGEDESGLWGNYYYDVENGVDTDIVFPFVYSRQSAVERTLAVFPNFWEHEAPESLSRWLFPFYYYGEDRLANSTTTWAMPYLGWQTPQTEVDMVLPVFYNQRDTDGDLFRLIAPLYLQMEDHADGSQFVAAGPVWYSGKGDGSYDTGVAPLLWWGEEANREDGYTVGFPLYWRFVDDGGTDAWTVLAPGWHHRHRDGWSAGIMPLTFAQRDRRRDLFRLGLLPFYYSNIKETSTFAAVPGYYHRFSPDSRTVLSPLVLHHSDDVDETSFTLAGPVYHRHDDKGTSAGIFPLMFSRENDDGSQWRTLLPLYFASDDAYGGWSRTALPLYHQRRSADGKEGVDLVAPWFRYFDEDMSVAGVPPLYVGADWADGSSLSTTALTYWNWKDADGHSGALLGPAYRITDEQGSSTGLFPIAHGRFNRDGSRRAWLAPLVYHDRDASGEKTTTIAGPGFYSRDDTQQELDWGLAPLFWRFKNGEKGGSALFPAYYYEGSPTGHDFVSPVGYSHREGTNWNAWSTLYVGWGDQQQNTHAVLPLFMSRRSNDGSGLDLLLPFYANYKRSGGTRGGRVVFPLYWNFYNRDDNRDATVLFPLYWRFNNPKHDVTVVAPWFKSERKDRDRVTHGLVPFYYYSSDPSGYTFNVLGGLYGVDKAKQSKRTDYQVLWIPFSAED